MKGDLKTNQKFHSNERPYKCTICGKAYKSKVHLNDHVQIIHNKVTKYQGIILDKSNENTIKKTRVLEN